VFFASQRGFHRMMRNLEIEWFDELDRYFSQPAIQAVETVTGAVFSSQEDEVRFQTTNYRFVYDRPQKIWMRDTGGMPGTVFTAMIGNAQALFRSNGQTWLEDQNAVDDAGTVYTGIIRSPWIGPVEGWLRVYRARIVGMRTNPDGGAITPVMKIYFDNDDAQFESSTGFVGGSELLTRGEMRPRRQKCSRFSLELTVTSDSTPLRLEAWAVVVGMKQGSQPLPQNDRWA
jgi:hypothetical protein